MKILTILIVFFLFSLPTFAKEDKKLSKKDLIISGITSKKDLIITGITFLNPALSISTLVSNANALQKILSLGSLAYTTKEGKTITESAYSQGLKKKCIIKNILNKKENC